MLNTFDTRKKGELAQIFTPKKVASFMASLFPDAGGACSLLDAGAGTGVLSAAFLSRWRAGGFRFRQVVVDAFEIDPALHTSLSENLRAFERGTDLSVRIREEDFVVTASEALAGSLFSTALPRYTHVILNPPYRKIGSRSLHRLLLRRAGIETVNLYSAFLALAVLLSAPQGQIVAIVPRSFCNGTYYRPFRNLVLEHAAIRHIHLFTSRNRVFEGAGVLQENVIVRLERGGQPGPVNVSTSTDASFSDFAVKEHPFEDIVHPADEERFIRIPAAANPGGMRFPEAARHTLRELGISVSTGPVVDFRLRPHLREMPRPGTVPLLYPHHCQKMRAAWPVAHTRKPNAIAYNAETRKWLYPKGYYCVVRRFSSKEERRRLVASVVTPDILGDAPMLGFENHLNVFHEGRKGLQRELAYGLAVFLNSTIVDEKFRQFSGHTQVNATDLKALQYPAREVLSRLGAWAARQSLLTQAMIDTKIAELTP